MSSNAKLHDYDRRQGDAYFTVESDRLVPILDKHTGIHGVVHEPAAGAADMSSELAKLPGVTKVYASDISPAAPGVSQGSIEDIDGSLGVDWCVSNLPFRGQDKLMAHLLAVYPTSRHAYLTRAGFIHPAKRDSLIHNNPRFVGIIAIAKRVKWIVGSTGHPSSDYVWIVFSEVGRSNTPKLAFENGPQFSFFKEAK